MKSSLRILAATVVLFTLAGCATKTKLMVEQQPEIDWSKYKTFSVLPMTEHVPGASPTIVSAVVPAILDATKRGFLAKGYVEAAPESADLVINITAGWLPKINVRNWNYVPSYVGSNWYSSYSDFMVSTGAVQVDTFEQGNLALQTYDAKTKQMIWVGFGQAMKEERMSVPDRVDKVREAITELLQSLPPAAK